MAPSKLNLGNLPEDLQSIVFSKIARPTDLVSICLTSKSFHELAVRFLYKTLVLDVGSKTDKRIASLVSPRNIGLKWIREIELYKADVDHDCNMTLQAEFAIRMLLEFLPENQLEKFSWHPWRSFALTNLELLYRKQRKMNWLEAIALDKTVDKALIRSLKLDSVVSNVTRIGLYPDSRDTLLLSNEILKRLKRVEKLTLHANFADAEIEIPAAELQDTPTVPGLITSTIFQHMMPFVSCTALVLTELTLQNVHVRYAADTYCRIIDFTYLKHLRVFGCLGAESLFAEMCKSRSLPLKLVSLEFKHDADEDGEAILALDTLLPLLSGLQKLFIDISHAKGGPSHTSIVRHAATLKQLLVHSYDGDPADSEDDEHIWETESFVKICETCTQLEQVSVAFPPTPIFRMTDDFLLWVKAVAAMPKLVTLNVTTWPTNTPSSTRLPRKAYECLLGSVAQDFFEASIEAAKEKRRKQRENASKKMEGNETATVAEVLTSTPATSTTVAAPASGTTAIATDHENDDDEASTANACRPTILPGDSTFTSSLTTIAWGSHDRLYERLDPRTGLVYMLGRVSSPADPHGVTSPAAVQVSWNKRRFDEEKSEILEFAISRTMRPPCREGPGPTGGIFSRAAGLGTGDDGDDEEETGNEEVIEILEEDEESVSDEGDHAIEPFVPERPWNIEGREPTDEEMEGMSPREREAWSVWIP